MTGEGAGIRVRNAEPLRHLARSWQGCDLAEAYSAFREAFLRDSGYKHMEVTEVFPRRYSNSE
jgi:hypothetical protein